MNRGNISCYYHNTKPSRLKMLDELFNLFFYVLCQPIFNHVLYPVFEPICWLTGSILVSAISLGFIHPSTKKKTKSSGVWGYYKGEQYYFDRELVAALGFLAWVIFIIVFAGIKFS